MKIVIFLCAAIWLAATVSGVVYMARYENTPGEKSDLYPAVFPPDSRIKPFSDRATLIFFVHPKCPCTRASLRELARLMSDLDSKLQAYVVLIKPENADANWTETDLRARAEAIPNVRVLIDEGEHETKIFHARTSGLTLLYDREGNLRFDGGITASRGHEGDNAGARAVFDIVTNNAGNRAETFVFGCLLNAKSCPDEATGDMQ